MRSFSRTARVLVAAVGAVLLLAGCGNGDGEGDAGDAITTATTTTTAPAASDDAATVGTAETDLGVILADGEGRTLYVFLNDEDNVSNCTGGCLETWPPLYAESVEAGGDVDSSLLDTTTSNETSQAQATYGGRPLYYFATDTEPGDTNGQGVGDVWFIVGTDGEPIR